ncbi:MAG: hypothetical protein IPI05_02555 [Flavobacteriales bacterium]|nr:hypothetical protein [Flavobacteriales bacterium]
MKPEVPGTPTSADRWAERWGWAIIAAAVLLVYWPLSTFSYGMVQGDTLDCWVPWRWFIASALQDGHFPLWDPFAQSGYPIYADLQGPAWYPMSIVLGGTIGHTLYTLQALFLGYVIVGGIGMMRLVRRIGSDARIALVIGLAYALSGFFTAHEMHFYAVISAALLPWLISAQLRLIERPSWRPAVEAAIFQGLLLTGGNHTFTLIGTWLLLALIIVYAVRAWRKSDRAFVFRLLRYEVLFAVLTLVMAVGTIYAYVEVSPYLARSAGMTYSDAAVNPFTWHAAWSYFFPYAVGTDAAWLGTDPTMANGYVGVLVLLFTVLAVFRRRTVVENVIAVFGILCLLASFGAALPVHRVLWSVVPGLDLFRFPSYYQWFTALAAAVLAAGTLSQWPALMAKRPRVLKGAIGIAILIVGAALVRAWMMHTSEPPFGQGDTVYEQMTGLWRWHRVLLAAPVSLLALIGLWWWATAKKRRWWPLLLLVFIEMGWATTLAQWNTALGDYSPAMLQGRIDEQPKGPVWPELVPMGNNTDGSATLKYIWKNVQNFEGKPSHDGFNSFWLKDANRIAAEEPGLFAAMKLQPLVYLTDSVVQAGQYDPATVDPANDSALVVLAEGEEVKEVLRHMPSDLVQVTGFDHDGISLHVKTAHPTFAMLQQAWYPGWTATVDGVPADILRANIAFFGIVLPAGKHELQFRFEKPVVPWLLGISLLVFLGSCFLLAFTRPASLSSIMLKVALVLLTLTIGWALFAHRPKAERLPRAVESLLHQIDVTSQKALPIVINTGRYPALEQLFQWRETHALRAENAQRAGKVLRHVQRYANTPFWWMDAGLPVAPAVRAALLQHLQVDTVLRADGFDAVLLLPAEGALDATPLHDSSKEGGEWLDQASPWTAAYRVPTSELLALAPGSLVVQVAYRSQGASEPSIVIERRRGDRITDYESFPLPHGGTADSLLTACVVRNLRELRHADEVVGVYLWNNGPDSVQVREFKVERTGRDLSRW